MSNPRNWIDLALCQASDDQLRAEVNRRWGEDDCPTARAHQERIRELEAQCSFEKAKSEEVLRQRANAIRKSFFASNERALEQGVGIQSLPPRDDSHYFLDVDLLCKDENE